MTTIRRLTKLINGTALVLILGMVATGATAADKPLDLRLIDGDTLVLTATGERVRIENIDAPEINGACRREEIAAHTATGFLEGILGRGTFSIARSGKDRYGRTLARLTLYDRNGEVFDVGEAMIAFGMAERWGSGTRPRDRLCP